MSRDRDVVACCGARWSGVWFALPWLIGLCGLTVFPMAASCFLSLVRWDGLSLSDDVSWVGIGHYREIVAEDSRFRIALWNSLFYTVVSVPLTVVWSLVLALLLNARVRGLAIFRTAIMLPTMLGGVATVMMWSWLFNPRFGLVNRGLRAVYGWLDPLVVWMGGTGTSGWTTPDWFYSPSACKPSLVLMHVWLGGTGVLVFLGALHRVPRRLLEAAELDGASRWRRFWSVTVWHLSPGVLFNIIVGVVFSMQAFDFPYLLYNRSQGDGLLFYMLYLYRAAFEPPYRLGYASALGWVLFAVIAVLVTPLLAIAQRWVHYESRR